MKNLVIVESPAKAKTIENYLGKDFTVKSSYGHVRDLPSKGLNVDIENGFKPTYQISPDKKDTIKTLKKLAEDAELVWLATDDDREGEAISWHLKEALDLNDKKVRRIVFHEITKSAIQNALASPRGIDDNLVNAQQARRVLDRLVGFELSPILWKKIKTGLSAGRVQSVAVRLAVEREREIEAFKPTSEYRVRAYFKTNAGKTFSADLKNKLKTYEEARDFLEKCKGATFSVKDLEKKPSKRSPAPPFTTSTLQQQASTKLGFSVAQTMTLAQRLYENGKITYMRTDSTALANEAKENAKNEIITSYGKDYAKPRNYQTKNENAQEAHEAIRPTDFSVHAVDGDRNEQRLYDLIRKRALASQMAEAQLEKTTANIGISTMPDTNLIAQGEVIKFEGFLKVYIEASIEEEEEEEEEKDMLPPLSKGEQVNLDNITATQRFSRPPARYTEASLVKELEAKGIGRPSTYAPTISTVQKRGYIIKESREGWQRNYQVLSLTHDQIEDETKTETTGAEKNKLFPTDIAMLVTDFLVEHFPKVTDYKFTADVEQDFDEIARGKINWSKMIDQFYNGFHERVVNTENVPRSSIQKIRELGTDPKTGRPVYARIGKYGPYVQLGDRDTEEEKARFAKLLKGQHVESITLEEALELFKLPREVGKFEGEPVVAGIGRFGPYLRHNNKFVSLPKEDDPLSVNIDRAIELILEKRKRDAEKYIKTFEEDENTMILKGRWGPYIKMGKKNIKIPKDKEPADLTLEECYELAKNAPEKKKGKKKSTTSKKS